MNEGLMGLEQHEGQYLMTEFSFLSELTLWLFSTNQKHNKMLYTQFHYYVPYICMNSSVGAILLWMFYV